MLLSPCSDVCHDEKRGVSRQAAVPLFRTAHQKSGTTALAAYLRQHLRFTCLRRKNFISSLMMKRSSARARAAALHRHFRRPNPIRRGNANQPLLGSSRANLALQLGYALNRYSAQLIELTSPCSRWQQKGSRCSTPRYCSAQMNYQQQSVYFQVPDASAVDPSRG